MFTTFKPFLKCSAIATAAVALYLSTAPASAYQTVQHFDQPEQRDGYGRVTVEAATIWVLSCNGAGENGGSYYIYQYLKRPAYRAVLPPHWTAIGGRDFGTFGQAAGTACAARR